MTRRRFWAVFRWVFITVAVGFSLWRDGWKVALALLVFLLVYDLVTGWVIERLDIRRSMTRKAQDMLDQERPT